MNWRAHSRLDVQRTSCKALWPPPTRPLSKHERRRRRKRRLPASRSRSTGWHRGYGDHEWRSFLSRAGHLKDHSPHALLTKNPWPHPQQPVFKINPNPPTNDKTKKKKKNLKKKNNNLPWGLPPASHQGELLRLLPPRDSTDETPNMSTFRFKIRSFYSSLSPRADARAVKWAAADWITWV